jgi:integrase
VAVAQVPQSVHDNAVGLSAARFNVRRRLRTILAEAGITDVTPHSFRRTVATVLDRVNGPDLAAELLGHTSSRITKQHYIEPDETVNPVTANILESLAPRSGRDG